MYNKNVLLTFHYSIVLWGSGLLARSSGYHGAEHAASSKSAEAQRLTNERTRPYQRGVALGVRRERVSLKRKIKTQTTTCCKRLRAFYFHPSAFGLMCSSPPHSPPATNPPNTRDVSRIRLWFPPREVQSFGNNFLPFFLFFFLKRHCCL